MNLGQRSEEQTRAEIRPGVLELLAFERALSDLPRRILQEHRESLCHRIGNEDIVQKIARLAKAEAELCNQKGWWGDEDEAERLEIEIAELKDQLGLTEVAVSSSDASGKVGEQPATSSDAARSLRRIYFASREMGLVCHDYVQRDYGT